MDSQSWLIVVFGVAAASYFFRAVPFVISARVRLPPHVMEWLVLMSLAIIAALISKTFFIRGGKLDFSQAWVQLSAISIAAAVQRKTGNMPVALASGVGAALIIRSFLGY